MKIATAPRNPSRTGQKRKIVARVSAALESHQPSRYRLVVDADSLEKHGEDWVIVVTPDREGMPLGDSVQRMMAAEDELRKRWKLNISLLPVLPPEDD